MKKISTIFLQVVIVALGIVTLAIMIRFPLTEGRAVNLDLLSIYSDPFIIYGYLASIPFFVALYQAFTLLGYIGKNKVFSLSSVKALRTIKYCALILVVLIAAPVVYLFIARPGDDIAGGVAMGLFLIFVSVVITAAAAMFEGIVQSAVDVKSETT